MFHSGTKEHPASGQLLDSAVQLAAPPPQEGEGEDDNCDNEAEELKGGVSLDLGEVAAGLVDVAEGLAQEDSSGLQESLISTADCKT